MSLYPQPLASIVTEIRVGEYVLVAHVTCEVAPRPSFESDEKHHFKYSIKSAQCYHMERLGAVFYPRFTLSGHSSLAIIPKSTNYIRIIIVDEGLPPPIDIHLIRAAIPDRVDVMPYDSDWRMHLQEMVALESLVCILAVAFFTSIGVSDANILLP